YYDGFGRVYRTIEKGDASTGDIYADMSFNARGSGASKTRPYYAGGAIYANTVAFDALDRPVSVTAPDAAVLSTSYGAGTSTTTAQQTHVVVNRRAGATAYRDEISGTSTYTSRVTVDALGREVSTVDPEGNTITRTYDSLGRVTRVVDPDL